jgi:hypothetical protein
MEGGGVDAGNMENGEYSVRTQALDATASVCQLM